MQAKHPDKRVTAYRSSKKTVCNRLSGALLLGASGSVLALDLPPEIAQGVSNATALSAGTALLNTCVTGRNQGNQFQEDCNAIFGERDPNVSANAVNQVAADQVAAQNAAATRQFNSNLTTLGGRMAQLRLAGNVSGFGDNIGLAQRDVLGRAIGGGASGDMAFGKLGTFFNIKYRWGDEDATRFQPGLDFDGWGATLGMDYRFSDRAAGGLALNYMKDKVDYSANRGDMDSEAWGLTAYGTTYFDSGLYLSGMLGYNWVDYDLQRDLIYSTGPQDVSQVASSDTDGDMFLFSIGAGYEIASGATNFTPSVRLDYIKNEVDGFTESMRNPGTDGGGMAVAMDSASYKSLTSRLGVQISRAFSVSSGVILPSLQLDWVHEFENDQKRIGGRFIGDVLPNGTPFFVFTNNPDEDYFDLQLAISSQYAGGKSAFLSYNTLLGYSDLSYHAVNAGFRMEF